MITLSLLFFGCASNKELVKYLKTCHNSESYQSGFIQVDKKELKEKLGDNESLRYIGSENESHFFIHYYDKTIKMQTGFKLDESINLTKHEIDFRSNSLFKEDQGKYKDSYFIKINQL
ncbi:MAG: hypothetical protein ACI94Y_003439 [Maribacter sp.]|jgi:hypothetical protein